MMDSMLVAFDTLAASPSLSLLHRYETRLHLMYQRALRTLIMLRTIEPPEPPDDAAPNDPSPISEHSPPAVEPPPAPPHAPPPQPTDSEASCGAANPGCSRLSAGSRTPDTAAPAISQVLATPSVAPLHAGSETNARQNRPGSRAPA
jgi:hypothetical protein